MEPDYLLYSEVSPHWTPVRNVVEMPPVKCTLQGGSKGGRCDLWEPSPSRGLGVAPPKLKIDVNLPCKIL